MNVSMALYSTAAQHCKALHSTAKHCKAYKVSVVSHLSVVGPVFSHRHQLLFHLLPDGLDDLANLMLDVVMQAVHLAQDLVPFFQVEGLVSPGHFD